MTLIRRPVVTRDGRGADVAPRPSRARHGLWECDRRGLAAKRIRVVSYVERAGTYAFEVGGAANSGGRPTT